jgi:hypothetical protein
MFARAGMVVLIVSLALNGLLAWERSRNERSSIRGRPGGARPVASGTRPVGEVSSSCERRRKAVVAALLADSARLRAVLPPNQLFQSSPPNDVARSRLAPVVEQALGGASGGCTHALECKDFVCRIVIPGEGGTAQEQCLARLHRARPLWAYTREGLFFTAGPWAKNPLTGVGGYRKEVYLRLANADGAPIQDSNHGL